MGRFKILLEPIVSIILSFCDLSSLVYSQQGGICFCKHRMLLHIQMNLSCSIAYLFHCDVRQYLSYFGSCLGEPVTESFSSDSDA